MTSADCQKAISNPLPYPYTLPRHFIDNIVAHKVANWTTSLLSAPPQYDENISTELFRFIFDWIAITLSCCTVVHQTFEACLKSDRPLIPMAFLFLEIIIALYVLIIGILDLSGRAS